MPTSAENGSPTSKTLNAISFDAAERALFYLRDTAKEYGRLKGYMLFCEANLRRVKSMQMLNIESGSVAEKEAKAYASEPYLRAMTAYQDASADFETLKCYRDASAFCIETWRSVNASKAKGIDL